MMARKGQFFLLGAVLLITAFFIGSAITNEVFISISDDDLGYISSNVLDEFSYALNTGANSTGGVISLMNFTAFVNSSLAERYIDYSSLWVVTKNTSTNLNVTVGNWMEAQTIDLSIGGSSVSLYVPSGTINYTTFNSPGSNFTLHINFSESNGTLYTWRDKTSLYVYQNLTRSSTMSINEETY